MTTPTESFVQLNSGRFRTLTWRSGDETVLLLHGLTGVAEVWAPTVGFLSNQRTYIAVDQRGHGQSPCDPDMDYRVGAFVSDTKDLIRRLGRPVHLVGHSMGARVTLVLAARYPELLRSAVIVDIGPEASTKNINDTQAGLAARPDKFESREAALAFAFRNRPPTEADTAIFLARLKPAADQALMWRSPRESLNRCVAAQRSRSYWREWRKISLPSLFVHGGKSAEVSTRVADAMRAANPRIEFERMESIGHNIPLIAPEALAASLERFWRSLDRRGT